MTTIFVLVPSQQYIGPVPRVLKESPSQEIGSFSIDAAVRLSKPERLAGRNDRTVSEELNQKFNVPCVLTQLPVAVLRSTRAGTRIAGVSGVSGVSTPFPVTTPVNTDVVVHRISKLKSEGQPYENLDDEQ